MLSRDKLKETGQVCIWCLNLVDEVYWVFRFFKIHLLLTFMIDGDKVGETGKVVGIEHIEDLVKSSIENVRRIPQLAERLDDGRIKIVAGDGRRGYSAAAPFDAIHVGAAAPELPPAVRLHELSLINNLL